MEGDGGSLSKGFSIPTWPETAAEAEPNAEVRHIVLSRGSPSHGVEKIKHFEYFFLALFAETVVHEILWMCSLRANASVAFFRVRFKARLRKLCVLYDTL